MKRNVSAAALAALLIILLVLALPLFSFADAAEDSGVPDTSSAGAAFLYCMNTESVMYEKNADKALLPGPTVKMMTALLVSEHFDDFDEGVTVTGDLLEGYTSGGTGFKSGMSASVGELFAALVCGGSNDAAVILANLVSGSVSEFVSLMNERAKEIGMLHTVYSNPTGADDPSATTTVGDVFLLAQRLYTNGRFMEAAGAPSHYINCLKARVYNRNYFRTTWFTGKYYSTSINGMNAGVTSGAGYCVTASAEISGNSYICIVMNASSDDDNIYSYVVAKDLLDFGGKSFKYFEVISSARVFCTLPVRLGNETDSVCIMPKRASMVYLPISAYGTDDVEIRWGTSVDYLTAPIEEGTVVGAAEVYYKGDLMDTVELVVGASVSANDSSFVLYAVNKVLGSRLFYEILAAVVIIVLLFVGYRIYKKRASDHAFIHGEEDLCDEDELSLDDDEDDCEYQRSKPKGIFGGIKKSKRKNKKEGQ